VLEPDDSTLGGRPISGSGPESPTRPAWVVSMRLPGAFTAILQAEGNGTSCVIAEANRLIHAGCARNIHSMPFQVVLQEFHTSVLLFAP
jgi:hypothetical protein